MVRPDFGSAPCGCSSARQGAPAVQRPGEEAAEWSGSCDRSSPASGAAEHGAQGEAQPTHRQDPPAAGEPSGG